MKNLLLKDKLIVLGNFIQWKREKQNCLKMCNKRKKNFLKIFNHLNIMLITAVMATATVKANSSNES